MGGMNPNWSSLTKEGRIEALKAAWEPGATMAEIGARLGTTHNGVAGMYVRYRHLLGDYPLNKPRTPRKRRTNAEIAAAREIEAKAKAEQAAAAEQLAVRQAQEPHSAGITLMMFNGCRCKWPVNDPAKGEGHLFCGLPTDRVYCEHHTIKSVWRKAA
jgi:hypothetical protein